MTEAWLAAGLAVFALLNFTFAAAAFWRRNDLADVAWGPGFVLAFLAAEQASGEGWDARRILSLLLVTLWAGRLFWHVGRRTLRAEHEDERYRNWRRQWGRTWLVRSYFQVFALQGALLLMISAPLVWVAGSPHQPVGVWAVWGVLLWMVGFVFEAVSDEQLRRFKSQPQNKGRLMTQGLWAWSRHPNYFGEVVQWWGLALLAVPLPGGLWTLLSPVLITGLILYVSGVPILENLMADREGAAAYRARTSKFFPWPPSQ